MAKKRFNDDTDIAASFSLPGVEVYPNNRFGDIARKQGLETARNWREVREGTAKGMNDFAGNATSAMTTGVSFVPVVGDAVDATDMYNAYKNGDNVGMALAGLGFIPVVGNVIKSAGNKALRFSRVYGDAFKEVAKEYANKKIYDIVSKNERIKNIANNVDKVLGLYSTVDPKSVEFYMTDVKPRLEKIGINVDMNPDMFRYRYKLSEMDDAKGVYSYNIEKGKGKIYSRLPSNTGTIVHELTHRMQFNNAGKKGLKTTSETTDKILNDTYKVLPDVSNDAGDILEKEASNRQLRFMLWNNFVNVNGRPPSVDELNKVIDNIDGEKISDLADATNNGYFYEYKRAAKNNGMTNNDIGESYKNALKYVPVIGGSAIIYNKQNNDSNNMKNGGKVKKRFNNPEKRFLNLISEVSLR